MGKKRTIQWTDEAIATLDRLWIAGTCNEDIAKALEPLVGRRISSSAIRQASTRRQLQRSPEAQETAHKNRSAAQFARQLRKRQTNEELAATFANAPMTLPEEIPKDAPKSSEPYRGLGTTGRDPRQIAYIQELEHRRKS